ncbi:MAG: DUF3800 domain-containing protein [Thermoleophilia bacterium]|nr:DUF3800 domain-containing protein [Thermoleophilia bacterium]
MHLLFLDESGRLDQGGLFALGGIAIRDADWRELRDLWQATLHAHRWPLEREVKWHGIRKGEVPPALADAIFAALAAAPVTAYVVVMDLERGRERYPPDEHRFFRSAEEIYGTALMFLAERFHHRLAEEDDVGMIVVDSRFREEDMRLRRFFSELTEAGTPYVKLGRIVEGLFLSPSHYSIGLQCADLVVAATAASERAIGQGSGYVKKLEPRFARHPRSGAIDGVGIKRFPDPADRPREHYRLF